MPTALDHVVFLILAVANTLALRGTAARRLARRRRSLRLAAATIFEVGSVLVTFVAWLLQGRSLTAFGLGVPTTWTAWSGVALATLWALAIIWITTDMHRDGMRCAACRAEAFARFGTRPSPKRSRSTVVAFTISGITEEIVFRGFLILYVTACLDPLMPSAFALGGAVLATAVVFSACHAQHGAPAVAATLVAGLLLGAVTVLTGSLWPAIIAHAVQNAAVSSMAHRLAALPAPAPGARHTADCGGTS